MPLLWRSEKSTPDAWDGPQRVVVHAGFRKTGTTSVQDYLVINSGRLPKGLAVSPRDALTQPWRRAVAAQIDRPHRRALRREALALRVAVQQIEADTLVISDENLFGQSMVTRDGRDIFDLAAEFLPMVEEALSGASVEFVFYTRAKADWVRSAWAQGVKRSGISQSLEDWAAGLPNLDMDEGLTRIGAALKSPVHVFEMADDLSGDDPVMGRALFDLVGLDPATRAGLTIPGRANESLPSTALELLRKINGLGLEQKARRKVARVIEDNPEFFAR